MLLVRLLPLSPAPSSSCINIAQSLTNLPSGFCASSSMTTGGEANVLGTGVKDLIATMNELEKLGFSNLDISLAKCVVCGKPLRPVYLQTSD
jgi:hypothetical protein